MKRIVLLLMIVCCICTLTACNIHNSIEDIESSIINLPTNDFYVGNAMIDWKELDGFTGTVIKNYFIYERTNSLPGSLPADYYKPIIEACEIIVVEFSNQKDARQYKTCIEEIISTNGYPDWIIKMSNNVIVMAKTTDLLNLVW